VVAAAVDLENELDELYRLPLSEFTPGRNDLAKRLKAEGRDAESDEVKALKKPSVAAWLANRLAVERELDVQRLRKAGESLAKGQTSGSAESFREAQQEERHALGRLTDAAAELAAREGASSTAVDRAMQTLRAASLTEEGRELLRRGRITEELEPPGFEALAGLVVQPPPAKAPAKGKRRDDQKALKEARERAKALREEERELEAAAREAGREAARAEKHAAELRERADEARSAAEGAAARRAEADDEVKRLS